jgi:predicted CoA-binding protein
MDDNKMKKILCETRNIAVVGLSPKADRPSHGVASFLKEKGYRIIPVRPLIDNVLGEKAYSTLSEIPKEITIDIVDIFRKSQEVLPIVEEAIARGTKVIWMQEGVINDEAAALAEKAGLDVVMDLCILKEYNRLL